MASLVTRSLLSNSRHLSKICTRSFSVGGLLKSSEVAPVGSVPDFVKERLVGASQEVVDKMVSGYQALSLEDKALIEKVAGPWTELSLDEKAALYDRQYEQSWYEEEAERNVSGYFKDSLMVWVINILFCGFNFIQTEHCDMSEGGQPIFSRAKSDEWEAATEFRYAKYNPDPITRSIGGFR